MREPNPVFFIAIPFAWFGIVVISSLLMYWLGNLRDPISEIEYLGLGGGAVVAALSALMYWGDRRIYRRRSRELDEFARRAAEYQAKYPEERQ